MKPLWIDLETRSRVNLPQRGAYNYADDCSILILSYALGDEPVQRWEAWRGKPMPTKLVNMLADKRLELRAHNAAFERLVLSKHKLLTRNDYDRWYCTATQARASALPGGLEDAGRFITSALQKDPEGAKLMRQLSIPDERGQFSNSPALLTRYGEYCDADVEAMRSISGMLPALTYEARRVYGVSEAINDAGLPIDLDLCRLALKYADQEKAEARENVHWLTGGDVTTTQGPKITRWFYDRLHDDAQKMMMVYKKGVQKMTLDADTRANLLALAEDQPHLFDDDVLDVINAADAAAASSVAKFARMAAMTSPDGRLRGAFVLNGASGTGRFCVDGGTVIDTACGGVAISRIAVGTDVLTHLGRYRKVVAKCVKGVELMYHVTFSDGAWVICTRGHRVLDKGDWKRVDQLEGFSELTAAPEDGANVYEGLYDAGADIRDDEANLRHGEPGTARGHTGSGAENTPGCQSFQVKDGREKPDARQAHGSGDSAPKVSGAMERHAVSGFTPHSADEGYGPDNMAKGLPSSPHQRRPERQQVGQSMHCNGAGAPENTRRVLVGVTPVGERTVWDVTVEEDASYTAQGLTHHNSSKGAQLHNFPRKCADDPEKVKRLMMRGGDLGGPVMQVLKSMLRAAVAAPDGQRIVRADWNAVEARGLPWLAGSPSADRYLDAFRERGRDVYTEQARAAGLGEARQPGKVVVLALGYGGAEGALTVMGKGYNVQINDKAGVVKRWRAANRWAPTWWYDLKDQAVRALKRPGGWRASGRVQLRGATEGEMPALQMKLPSGRILYYPFAELGEDQFGVCITYRKAAFKPKAGAKEWPRAKLWHGLLAENATQGACACLLRHALIEGHKAKLPLRGHVHDEVISITSKARAAALVESISGVMLTPPDWAAGFPLAVETDVNQRFRK